MGAHKTASMPGLDKLRPVDALVPASVPVPAPAPASRLTPERATLSLRRSQRLDRYVRWLVIDDASVACFAALAVLFVHFGIFADEGTSGLYVPLALLFPVAWVAVLALGRSYERRFISEGTGEFRRVIESAVRFLAFIAIVSYILDLGFARGFAIVALPLATVGSLVVRSVGHRILQKARARGRASRRVILIGTERATAEFVRRLRSRKDHPFEVVGLLVDNARGRTVEGIPVVGDSTQAADAVVGSDADTVAVAAWSTLSQNDLRRLSWDFEDSDVEVLVASNLTDVSGPRISIQPMAGLPLLHVEKPEFTGLRRIAKGAFDRGVALAALVLLSPVLLALAIAIRLDSKGPAFFLQKRVCRGGKYFTMVKLRSMSVDAEEQLSDIAVDNVHDSGPLFKIHDDPRVTRVGSFLRRFSVDELPQLWNVARGQMSLVGPRPPLPSEVEQYEHDVQRRLLVKPGLTGLWQVSGRSDLSWEESVRLDLYYVENWSPLLDIVIIARTFHAVVARRGAY
ncbi:unannotated protein [freshwater metagenome]|uniref:Unannotated protein n=1 Tax=freshwater metagenome TaxID=449393 RepID=A0A6J7SDT1_9ZZZZ